MSTHSVRLVIGFQSLMLVLVAGRGVALAQADSTPFGADVFVGGVPRPEIPDGDAPSEFPRMGGWQAGASIRAGIRRPWLGWTGSYASYSNDAVRVKDLLGGVRATTPWLVGPNLTLRGFAHALAGYSWSAPAVGTGESAPAFVAGAGFDVLLLRVQVDYVRMNLPLVPRSSARGFIGGVVPLCFRGCRPDWQDGIPVRPRD